LDWINTPYKVILLEGGGFDYDDRVQELYRGRETGQPYYPLKSSRLHYFGGTTGHWAGMCTTFDAIDFTKRDWVPHSGWPITRKDLDPFYERAHRVVEIGPYNYDLGFWQKKYPDFIPLPFDKEVIWSKIWQFSPPTRFGKRYRETIFNAPNVHLYTYANLVDITANEAVSSVQEITVKNFTGKSHRVRAKYFILACNGIQNPRILLAANKQAPKGLGNDHDLVGRYFMEHLEIKSAELWLKDSDKLNLYRLGRDARAELAIHEKKQAELRILNGTASFSPLQIARKMKPAIEAWNGEDPRANLSTLRESGGKAYEKKWYEKFQLNGDKAYELFTRIEQAPNPRSQVTIDKEKDELGMPRAALNWELTEIDKRSIRALYLLIGQQLGITRLGRVKMMDYLDDENDKTWPTFTGGGWHHMGTTRMHEDPKQGVVDANCQVHGINNLFVAGSSCYTTGGAVNPTLTLIALSLRVSDRVRSLL
jgi:choline dehydrogenase-like flavoprotein